jgi:hypothetical protein
MENQTDIPGSCTPFTHKRSRGSAARFIRQFPGAFAGSKSRPYKFRQVKSFLLFSANYSRRSRTFRLRKGLMCEWVSNMEQVESLRNFLARPGEILMETTSALSPRWRC